MIVNKKIILASKSPRRQELIKGLEIPFEIVSYEVDESFDDTLTKHEIPLYLAQKKGEAFPNILLENEILLTADTIVWVDDEVLNKPSNAEEAQQMLRKLSGKVHTVYTGVTIRNANKTHTFHDATQVEFYPLTEEEVNLYIQNCRPFDKAGSYGIQDWMGTVGVKGIQGCFYNVMGFPSAKFYRELQYFSKQ